MTDDIQLPALPIGILFDRDFAQEYARDAVLADRERMGDSWQIVGWINEDALPAGYPYDAMYPHSRVDGVRMFPVFAPATVKESVTVQDERAAFEAWCVAHDLDINRYENAEYSYNDVYTDAAWEAWQARAARAPVADKLAEALRHFANNYLLDEYDDEELCIDHKHHSAVVALFDALAEYDRQKGGA